MLSEDGAGRVKVSVPASFFLLPWTQKIVGQVGKSWRILALDLVSVFCGDLWVREWFA